jgi:hypothetical protein
MVFLLLWPGFSSAQAIPGRWEKVDTLPRGASIIVTLTSGHRAIYTYIESGPDLLTLADENGTQIRLAKSDVLRIERQNRDRLRNGVLIGTGVGFAGGFLGLAAFNAKQTASGPIWDTESLGIYISAGLVGAGIGALTGAVIDRLKKESVVLYSRR